MDKTLTQKEIDALLAILPQDGAPVPDSSNNLARHYDFRSPDKFSKEQLRTLKMIHDNFAREASGALSAQLRANMHLKVVHIEQGRFADFMQNIPNPSLINVLKLNPLPGRVLLSMDVPTAMIMVDRLMGGYGRPGVERHMLTDIEQMLVRSVTEYISRTLQDAWKNLVALDIQVADETAMNPEFVQVALPSDAAIFIVFETALRDHMGMMSLCIPDGVLKPIAQDLSPHTWIAGETKEEEAPVEVLSSHLKHVKVEVAALLGEAMVSFEDLLHLQEGDVLVLDSTVNQPLPLLAGTNHKFLAQPGLSGSKLAMQIIEVLEEFGDE